MNEQKIVQKPPEYNTPLEYVQQHLIMLNQMQQRSLEQVRMISDLITSLEGDLEVVKTPQLRKTIEQMIEQNNNARKQGLEFIKQARKDLSLLKEVYKVVKE